MLILQSVLYFILAGLCEIGGGYLVWLWLREGKSIWLAVIAALVLILYGVIPTLQPQTSVASMLHTVASSFWWLFYGLAGR